MPRNTVLRIRWRQICHLEEALLRNFDSILGLCPSHATFADVIHAPFPHNCKFVDVICAACVWSGATEFSLCVREIDMCTVLLLYWTMIICATAHMCGHVPWLNPGSQDLLKLSCWGKTADTVDLRRRPSVTLKKWRRIQRRKKVWPTQTLNRRSAAISFRWYEPEKERPPDFVPLFNYKHKSEYSAAKKHCQPRP